MWLIVLMVVLLLLPMTLAAIVYLCTAAWRALDALLQGTIGAVRLTWRAACWAVRMTVRGTQLASKGAYRLRDWHHAGSTWAGQYLQSVWSAQANIARRRYIAGQLRRLRRARHQ